MTEWVKATKTDKWLPRYWRLSTFPLLASPARSSDDIIGAAFLLEYQKIQYIVTAKHVIEAKPYAMTFCKRNRKIVSVKTSTLETIKTNWVHHPVDSIDLSAVPFILPNSLVKELDLILITEPYWNKSNTVLRVGDEVAHLGYPDKATLKYTDGSPSVFPPGMPGTIIRIKKPFIIMKTAGAHGASGGPVFLRSDNNSPYLMGVAIEEKIFGKVTRPQEGEYLNETTALPISLVKDIIESNEMKNELDNIGIPSSWF